MAANEILFYVVAGLLIGSLYAIKFFTKMPSKNFLYGIPGVIIGLIIGSLLSIPLGKLPGDFGLWVPITVTLISVFGSVYIFYTRRFGIETHISEIYRAIRPQFTNISSAQKNSEIFLDTSAIIDGRILGVVRSGFLTGNLIVYKFVLEELQRIADSSDDLRREKGRKGLEFLDLLKKERNIKVQVRSEDVDVKEVDGKLIKLAKIRRSRILTTDYNLNKVATIQGVKVLNVNELSEAIKPVIIPGEKLNIKIVQSGKERGQGVGYLNDGTMIVVERGEGLVGKDVVAHITKIIQTPAGKMYFAVLKQNGVKNDRNQRKR